MTKKTSRVRQLGFIIIRYADKFNYGLHVSSPFSYFYNTFDGYVSDNSALCAKFHNYDFKV